MKKFTAIAIIMVMAIAAVFAAEKENEVTVTGPSTIELNFGITPVFKPAFAVKYKGNELADVATVSVLRSDVTNGILAGTSATFSILDKTQVNHAASMTIGFSLTDGHWVGADNKKYSALSFATFEADNTNDVKVQDAQGRNVNLAKVSTTGNASKLKMTYAGGGVARQYAAKQIGTFTVAWTADQSAPAQNYSSTITINATAR